jgi:two-component system OmpR family response regulator
VNAAVGARARHILVVDDDDDLRTNIASYLSGQGLVAHVAANASEMTAELARAPIELIVLDLMLPGEDGLSVCRRLSRSGGPAIIILSAMGDEIDRVLGLELGADDYLPKPCSPRELLARVRAVLRRRDGHGEGASSPGPLLRFEGFVFDVIHRRLTAPDGTDVVLTSGECGLLNAFLENPNRVLSRADILELGRGHSSQITERSVDVQLSRIRRKLNSCTDREIIHTLRGVGYVMGAKVVGS